MAAGKISIITLEELNPVSTHSFSLKAGVVEHFIQPLNNVWQTGKTPQATAVPFVVLKAIDTVSLFGTSMSIVLIAMDTSGELWWAVSDQNDNWSSQGWQKTPMGSNGSNYVSFDATCSDNVGLVVIGLSLKGGRLGVNFNPLDISIANGSVGSITWTHD